MSVKAEHVVWAVDDLKLPVDAAFDQARALESFPEEFPKAAANQEGRPPLPRPDAVAPAKEPPPDPFKSFLKEPWRAAPERQNQPHGPAPIFILPGPNVDTPAAGNPIDIRNDLSTPSVVRNPAARVRFSSTRQRRPIWLAPAGVSLVFIAGFLAIWGSMAPVSPEQSAAPEQPAPPRISVQTSPGETVTSTAVDGGRDTAAGDSFANVAPPSARSDRAGVSAGATGETQAGFAVQMATFQSAGRAAQAAQEFRNAGYPASSIERSLRDGTHVHAVILGPYLVRAEAERDRERAREVAGFDSGLIVPIDPALLSQKVQ